ncbi:MAG: TonB-dependent receptor [Chitinophagaceae bacterium]
MKRILILLITVFSTLLTFSQQDTIELVPVEVRALRANATAPFSKTNLVKEQLVKQNLGQDLPFLLNQTPSVVINSDAGNGVGYTGIRIRGTDATRINVTINGIPFNDPESQGTFFVDLPDLASSVRSIQIQRGVGTSSNGPGAFGATINMSTNEINKEVYAEFNNSYGSFNTLKNTIRVGTGLIGDHFTVDARASRISSNGYIDRASSNLKSAYLSGAYFNDKTTLRFTTFSGLEKTYQAWYGVSEADLKTNRRINSAGMARPGAPYDNETDNYQQDHYQFFWDQKLSPHLIFNTGLFYIKGKGFYEQYKARERFSKYGLPDVQRGNEVVSRTDLVRQLWLDNDFYGNIFSFLYTRPATKITLGGSLNNYEGGHIGYVTWTQQGMPTEKHTWYELPAHKKDRSVYAKWQQNLTPQFQLFTDVQWRNVDYKINGFRDHPDLIIHNNYHFLNPKIGLTFYNNSTMAFISFSRATKEPNRNDFEAGISNQPKPEILNDIEAGWEYTKGRMKLATNLYFMKYKDQLVLTGEINDVGAYSRTNIDDSYRAGIELQAAANVNTWFQIDGNIAFSRNKIKNFKEFIDDYDAGGQKVNEYTETDISFSPDIVAAANLTFKPLQAAEISLISKYVGKQYLDNTSNEARKLDPYYTQDIRLIFSLSRKYLKDVSFRGQGNNVFNKVYEPNGYTYSYYAGGALTTENYYFPMAGINWMLGVNIRL